MARSFTVQRGATRIVFGAGASKRIAEHIAPLSLQRILVVSTPGRRADASELARQLSAEVFAEAREHVPAEIVGRARKAAERIAADGVVAFGGGSAIGLAKALALGGALRVVVVPTTYSGSEMTPVYGITEASEKRTGRDERVRPSLVIYDPLLTHGLARGITVNSLWNAMAHAVEALWLDSDRATERVAEDALGLLSSALRRLAVQLDDEDARSDALEGAYLAGIAFADGGAGPHHKLCHVLGGMFGLPHAATHAAILPHVARAMATSSPRAMLAISRALGVVDPIAGLEALARRTHAPRSLAALGMGREGIARVLAATPLDKELVRAVLEGAFAPPEVVSTPVRGPDAIETMPDAFGVHESEALEGALPRNQNTPRPAPRGLYPELVNLTPFTSRRSDNLRLWLYRIRPSFSHGPLLPLPSARFAGELTDVEPNRTRWRPLEPREGDFLDGLVTLGASGEPTHGPGFAVHLYSGDADMNDRCFANADGDLLIVPQQGVLDIRTELGWLRAAPGSAVMIPRAIKFTVGMPSGASRGWMLEVFGTRLKLPERGPLGSNGLADERHLRAPVASFEDRLCPNGYQFVTKAGGRLFAAMQEHSPFDVVAWHGKPAPFVYDLSLFNAMGTVNFDHPDPSIHTVLTAPLDDHGRAVADFVVFPGRWEVAEHTFRPPSMHRNAASEINCVVRDPAPGGGYDPGVTFLTPLLTGHGISTKSYDTVLSTPDELAEKPRRIPDESLWIMFESALQFRLSRWARETDRRDPDFLAMFQGMQKRFDHR